MEATSIQPMNAVDIGKTYILSVIEEVPGIKALVLDAETTSIVSLVCPKSILLSSEVFLIETINNLQSKNLQFMKGIFFLRATEDNKTLLCKMLKNPQFSEYYIYFTNIPYSMSTQTTLHDLAQADEKSVVKIVKV